MTSGDISALTIFAIFIGGFIVVSIMMQIIGRNFAWHQELE